MTFSEDFSNSRIVDIMAGEVIDAVLRKGEYFFLCGVNRSVCLKADGDYNIRLANSILTSGYSIDAGLTKTLKGQVCKGVYREGLALKIELQSGIEVTLKSDVSRYIHCVDARMIARVEGQDITIQNGM